MEASITTYLATQGVLGIAVIALSTAVFKLWKKNEELNQKLVEIAGANGHEMIEFYKQDAANEAERSKAITQMSHSIDLLTEKINRGGN